MPEYIVKEPLRHDGKKYTLGGTVEMTAQQAKELIGLGVLEAGATASSPNTKPNATDTIVLVKGVKTIEELDALAKDEGRKTVVEAIEVRRKELSA